MRDYSNEDRWVSYGEVVHIQNLSDDELTELEDEVYKAIEEKETPLMESYLNEIGFEKERRELCIS